MAGKLRKRRLIPLFLISIGGAMAGDLRTVSAALKMTTDMERIGNHATNIAQWAMFAMTGEMPKEAHFSRLTQILHSVVCRFTMDC